MQWISSNPIGPWPGPNKAPCDACSPLPQPSCLHTTWASGRSQPWSQTVPHWPWIKISTLPEQELFHPLTRRTSPSATEFSVVSPAKQFSVNQQYCFYWPNATKGTRSCSFQHILLLNNTSSTRQRPLRVSTHNIHLKFAVTVYCPEMTFNDMQMSP
jgi:hypothetical protein